MSRLRVLQVTGSLEVGGAETMAVTLARELIRRGADVDFLVFGAERGALEAHVEQLGARVLRAELPQGMARLGRAPELTRIMTAHGPYDVVHSHVNRASGSVLAAAHRAGVPVRVAHSHFSSDSTSGLAPAAYRRLSDHLIHRHSTRLVACGESAGRHLFGERWSHGGFVLPNCVEVDRLLAARAHRESTRAALGVPPEQILLGAVGRLAPVKNHRFLLDVMEQLPSGGSQLVIAGVGPLRDEFESEIRLRDLGDRVRLLGLRDDVPDLLAAMDVLLMPSLHEGLPTSLVEAQASGVRALVSESVTREVDLGLGGVSFLPIDDPHAWAAAIHRPSAPRPAPGPLRERFSALGYDAAGAVERLLTVYGLEP